MKKPTLTLAALTGAAVTTIALSTSSFTGPSSPQDSTVRIVRYPGTIDLDQHGGLTENSVNAAADWLESQLTHDNRRWRLLTALNTTAVAGHNSFYLQGGTDPSQTSPLIFVRD